MMHPLSDAQSKNIGEGTNIWHFCVVLPYAKICKNALIAAGSVVVKDIKPGEKFIHKR